MPSKAPVTVRQDLTATRCGWLCLVEGTVHPSTVVTSSYCHLQQLRRGPHCKCGSTARHPPEGAAEAGMGTSSSSWRSEASTACCAASPAHHAGASSSRGSIPRRSERASCPSTMGA
ncbi:hypothetical protein GWK47_023558 [Chionoecetes opilio]|uniref:Uncharacterized protein n=1 Tax=Chionoecetes opilio TaxID=41210 RepID=A0A8J5CJN0_CHIOP|nr:hypothetical protein GWK47_023558 [Chionoecetes opilio]